MRGDDRRTEVAQGAEEAAHLDLGGIPFQDDVAGVLKTLNGLESLSLLRTGVTDAGLKELKDLPKLQALNLEQAFRVTDAGMQELAGTRVSPPCRWARPG